jgi:formylglycine-generating enzyme required for sulfatase activity
MPVVRRNNRTVGPGDVAPARRLGAILLVGACGLLPLSAGAAVAASNSFDIPAWAFDRGNAQTFLEWQGAGPMVAYGGRSPVVVEYDLEFPLTGQYTLHILFAAAQARPVDLLLDGRPLGKVCRGVSGSWITTSAQWEEAMRLSLAKGQHTLRFQRPGDFPHVVSLRFESSAPLPEGWAQHRPKARKLHDPPPVPEFEPWQPEPEVESVRLAIEDLIARFGPAYPQGPACLQRLDELQARLRSNPAGPAKAALVALQREALLANPLLDFDRLLVVKRHHKAPDLGLPRNWQSNSCLPKNGYEDSLEVISSLRARAEMKTLFRPGRDVFVGDVDLHWDATKLLFSMPGANGRWQVFELALDPARAAAAGPPRPLTGEQPDVDSYDACYLPDGRILFTSTACFIGVPCVYGSSHVATLYRLEADGQRIRQLCFDQEHDWCPVVMNNGRILYTRWEYTDTPHSNTRLLFHMNPDGTEQTEFLGSNSYWPNSFFYARPIPGSMSKVIAVIGGHHDHPRMGELVLFDAAQGRHEASGAVQRIPGRGLKVQPLIRDGLTVSSWPKFLHPFPLSEKHFLASCKPNPEAPWGIYLADAFDNLVPIKQLSDYALFEPVPLRASAPPPVLPDKVDLARKDAIVVIQDIYSGDGLQGVPRGTVKSLRLFTYHFAYQGMGGLLGVVGADGPWDIKRVLGTVPVHADGSARFRVPANLPISLQPLDAEGKAIQLMRSWMTAMPGELVQCTGCHERQNTAPPVKNALALTQPLAEIQPWRGPPRGFSYPREVQPVIDRYCTSCHNPDWTRPDGRKICDLRGTVKLTNWSSVTPGNGGAHAGKFSVGYQELQRFVRRPGIESDYHLLTPMEFHADTTDLVQMLQQGHYGVSLDAESWDRLVTWIDLNCPYHGTWGEEIANPGPQRQRRRNLLRLYANLDDDPEAILQSEWTAAAGPSPTVSPSLSSVPPKTAAPAHTSQSLGVSPWTFDASEARRRQSAAGPAVRRSVELGGGVKLELVLIPPGEFVMGASHGTAQEQPAAPVRLERSYWLGAREVDNRTYALFDPGHDSRVEDKNTYQFGIHGYPANLPEQPVVRVSWNEAMAFCAWLSARTGERFSLPTEAQWEYACRAGTDTPFHFGRLDADFSRHANLADAKLSEFASDPYSVDVPLKDPTPYDDWIPKDRRWNDGALLTVPSGRYQPNPWGVHDLHGNAAEWTRSTFAAYPYRAEDGRESGRSEGRKVVRGGSWRDVPARATSSFRLSYPSWQRVYNVGFRVISQGRAPAVAGLSAAQ